jgi:hypothetical protein
LFQDRNILLSFGYIVHSEAVQGSLKVTNPDACLTRTHLLVALGGFAQL